MDTKHQKADFSKIISDSKILSNDKQSMLYNVLTEYELLFGGTLGTCKTKPVDIGLQPGAKPYDSEPYLVHQLHKAVFRKEV